MNALDFLTEATSTGASRSLHRRRPATLLQKGGKNRYVLRGTLMPAQTEALIARSTVWPTAIFHVSCGPETTTFLSLSPGFPFRISAYMQRGSMAAVIRVITFELPDPRALASRSR